MKSVSVVRDDAVATGVTTKVAGCFTDESLGGMLPLAPECNSDSLICDCSYDCNPYMLLCAVLLLPMDTNLIIQAFSR